MSTFDFGGMESHLGQWNWPKAVFFPVCRYGKGEQNYDQPNRRGIHESANADAKYGNAVRRAEDTESLELRQQAARSICLRQMRPFVQEEGLAATPWALGVRKGAAI